MPQPDIDDLDVQGQTVHNTYAEKQQTDSLHKLVNIVIPTKALIYRRTRLMRRKACRDIARGNSIA